MCIYIYTYIHIYIYIYCYRCRYRKCERQALKKKEKDRIESVKAISMFFLLFVCLFTYVVQLNSCFVSRRQIIIYCQRIRHENNDIFEGEKRGNTQKLASSILTGCMTHTLRLRVIGQHELQTCMKC